LPEVLETRAIAPGVRIAGSDLVSAADRGTAIHDAFRILLQRPDLKEKVAAHCRLESDEVEALAMQADGLRRALIEQGYPDLHVEQPLEIALADGGTQTVIHRSDRGRPRWLSDRRSQERRRGRSCRAFRDMAATGRLRRCGGSNWWQACERRGHFWTDMGEWSVGRLSTHGMG
jgi:hypothetical protein